ncbi:MAG TPA: helix-turn-helix domain-containing protein [Novosphingobium sp.]|nr:helix-turn-helix domain-containing protein [Novosphingobium sp.]
MTDNHIEQDFSPETARPGSHSAVPVPRYILYGEAGTRPDWFVNVEPLDKRCRTRGWVIKPHTHPRFSQIMLVTRGAGMMRVEAEDQPFGPGSVMVVPPHRIHGFHYEQHTRGWVITIENHYFDDLLERAPALRQLMGRFGVTDLPVTVLSGLDGDFQRLMDELDSQQSGSAIGAEIHLLAILLQLYRHWPQSVQAPPPGHSRGELVARFRQLVEAEFRRQPPLPDMAAQLGVSVSQLRAACAQVAGLSPLAILHERLLGEARRCLAYTAQPITAIAADLGFSEASYFTRFFTRKTGDTPTAWRRGHSFLTGLSERPAA